MNESGMVYECHVSHKPDCPFKEGIQCGNIPKRLNSEVDRGNVLNIPLYFRSEIVKTSPDQPFYSSQSSRRETFKVPDAMKSLAESLAKCGFHFRGHSGHNINIQCFWCKLDVTIDLNKDTDIWRIHRERSRNCGYVELKKGRLFCEERLQCSGVHERGDSVQSVKCIDCGLEERCVRFEPCSHFLLCADCAATAICCKCGQEITAKHHASFLPGILGSLTNYIDVYITFVTLCINHVIYIYIG